MAIVDAVGGTKLASQRICSATESRSVDEWIQGVAEAAADYSNWCLADSIEEVESWGTFLLERADYSHWVRHALDKENGVVDDRPKMPWRYGAWSGAVVGVDVESRIHSRSVVVAIQHILTNLASGVEGADCHATVAAEAAPGADEAQSCPLVDSGSPEDLAPDRMATSLAHLRFARTVQEHNEAAGRTVCRPIASPRDPAKRSSVHSQRSTMADWCFSAHLDSHSPSSLASTVGSSASSHLLPCVCMVRKQNETPLFQLDAA
jgi:hypothetical protein